MVIVCTSRLVIVADGSWADSLAKTTECRSLSAASIVRAVPCGCPSERRMPINWLVAIWMRAERSSSELPWVGSLTVAKMAWKRVKTLIKFIVASVGALRCVVCGLLVVLVWFDGDTLNPKRTLYAVSPVGQDTKAPVHQSRSKTRWSNAAETRGERIPQATRRISCYNVFRELSSFPQHERK